LDEPEQISLLAEIEALATGARFVPYDIVMVSGSRYAITERDKVLVGRTVVFVFPAKGGQHLLRQNQISEVNIEELTS
jgi:hypothetical protein